MKAFWKNRIKSEQDKFFLEFSKTEDEFLFPYEVKVNSAYIKALRRAKILDENREKKLLKAIDEIYKEFKNKKINYSFDYEDIHTFFFHLLKKKTKALSKFLHAGRSRNDLVVTELRLFCKDKILQIIESISSLQKEILKKAQKYKDKPFLAFTHTKFSQLVLFSHFLLNYIWYLEDDKALFKEFLDRVDVLILGSQSIGGTQIPLDTEFLKKELGFKKVVFNSIYGTDNRKFVLEFLFSNLCIGITLQKISQDLIFYFQDNLRFIDLDERFLTGSSAMPHKKNPDALELIRAKISLLFADFTGFSYLLRGLITGYNRDYQLDKFYLIRSMKVVEDVLVLLESIFKSIKLNEKNVLKAIKENDFVFAPELSEYLMRKGCDYENSYKITTKILSYCEENKIKISDLDLKDFKRFNKRFEEDIEEVLDCKKLFELKKTRPSSSVSSVNNQINYFKKILK